MTKSTIHPITVAVFIFTLTLAVFLSMVKADDYTDREVKFWGIITSDEEWGGLVAYGSYYCNVMVTEIIYDPKNTMSVNQNVTIAYEYQLHLRRGETVICYGINGINCTVAPKQCYGYVVCKPTPPYYVTRRNVTRPAKLLLTTDKQSTCMGKMSQ